MEISIVIYCSPFVDFILLKSILASSIYSVGGGHFIGVFYPVSSYCESCSILFCFYWSHPANKLPLCDIFHPFYRYLVLVDDFDRVGRFTNNPNSLTNNRLHGFLHFVLLINCLY